jgi:hypothetical protein
MGLTTNRHGEEGPVDAPTEEALSGDQLLRRREATDCQVEEEVSVWEDTTWWEGLNSREAFWDARQKIRKGHKLMITALNAYG